MAHFHSQKVIIALALWVVAISGLPMAIYDDLAQGLYSASCDSQAAGHCVSTLETSCNNFDGFFSSDVVSCIDHCICTWSPTDESDAVDMEVQLVQGIEVCQLRNHRHGDI